MIIFFKRDIIRAFKSEKGIILPEIMGFYWMLIYSSCSLSIRNLFLRPVSNSLSLSEVWRAELFLNKMKNVAQCNEIQLS